MNFQTSKLDNSIRHGLILVMCVGIGFCAKHVQLDIDIDIGDVCRNWLLCKTCSIRHRHGLILVMRVGKVAFVQNTLL